ncbi:hypothetical protein CC1G_01748 [Coprinopsis cinerea okayama7|uniref:Ima1 N-terminal domain-containing protein n=1 Tax=Coprinopsis cinerea (strain Okayama-7 / 130 / ATCC MYA-4618 / FGSC 9003) TaxID=240176 RepID=A8N2A8_COPC7|nr:hypothetical protein CC1G_01748 [Coprinopsis cinerea okayama7\|eukprot:XP_001829068.1 hypothetical protein CC1G_01748 [Coprinopsis cinerea okayama7\
MYQEHLNRASFSKRASPSKDRLPNLHRPGPFCHTCQLNQQVIVNLLSTYLPPPEHPEYKQRVKNLPQYKESLYTRYPPLCEACRPAVEEEIQHKDQMARRKALGGWLKGGKERQRRVSGTPGLKEKIIVESIHWRIRGVLWLSFSFVSIASLILELMHYPTLSRLPSLPAYVLPILIFVSLLWTAWDPTYLQVQKAQLQGRDVRVHGKRNYIICQMTAWFSRLVFSITIALQHRQIQIMPGVLQQYRFHLALGLTIEIIALLGRFLFLQIQHPPPIRLIDTHSHLNTLSRSATPATSASQSSTPITTSFPKLTEHDLLASLTLSSKPVMTPPNPVFGLPSLGSSASMPLITKDDDAMDWSPIDDEPGVKRKAKEAEDSSSWLRPQRFFAPEKPTGLENLFARTRLDDDDMMVDQPPPPSRLSFSAMLKRGKQWWIPILITVLSMLFAYLGFLLIRRRAVVRAYYDAQTHAEL